MGEDTKIAWTDHTFSPWEGCTKVSEGCRFCYAETRNAHWHPRLKGVSGSGAAHWGAHSPRLPRTDKFWREPVKWNTAAAQDGVQRRVFCASLADVFEQLPDGHPQAIWMEEERDRLWTLIESTPALSWLLLTKRPQNVMGMVPWRWRNALPGNVWMGTTAEDQQRLDERVPELARIPARVRFLSLEPLLGPVSFRPKASGPADMLRMMDAGDAARPALLDGISWLIVGGESGPGCRPMEREWARGIFAQARTHQHPPALFFKQEGGHPDKRDRMDQFPADLHVREFPGGDR